ncbi:MAG: hypothetical protein ABSC19_02595, partial [Syntrophorhabdales bacterium]
GESSLSEPIQGQNYGAIVAAMSRAVDQLGKELVGAMKPMLAQAAAGARSSGAARLRGRSPDNQGNL